MSSTIIKKHMLFGLVCMASLTLIISSGAQSAYTSNTQEYDLKQTANREIKQKTPILNLGALLGDNRAHLTAASAIQFSTAAYSVNEQSGSTVITIIRSGDTSGAATVEYKTSDGSARQTTDYTLTSGTLNFSAGETSKSFSVLVTNNAYIDGNRTVNLSLSNPTGATLGTPMAAVLTVIDNDSSNAITNPNDDAEFFVRQHYYDFLNRSPDQGGLDYWKSQITQCGSDGACIHQRRVGVSAAYFIEQEFQQTGFFLYRYIKAALGVRPSYVQFAQDRSTLKVGPELEATKEAFAENFVLRPEFIAKYGAASACANFTDSLISTVLSGSSVNMAARRSELIAECNAYAGNATAQRARVIRKLIEYPEFMQAEYNPAFVLTEYFGYLRRNPDEGGYQFWLDVVNNRVTNNYLAMVCAFITSKEYQERFSGVTTHSNVDCGAPIPEASSCTYSLSATSQQVPAGGISGTVNLTTGCNWAASSNSSWISITSGGSGRGNSTISYTVAANSSPSPRTGSLTIGWKTFYITQAGGNPVEEPEQYSPAQVTLTDASELAFNPLSGIVRFRVTGATLSTSPANVVVLRNDEALAANNIQLAADAVTLTAALQEGRNHIILMAYDLQGLLVYKEVILWAGNRSLAVTVLDENNQLANGVTVTAKLGDDQQVSASGTSVSGSVTFNNLPDRTIILDAVASGNRFATIATTGGEGAVQYKLVGFSTPSTVNNNDISLGTAGWNIGTAPVTVVTHDEGPAPAPSSTDVMPSLDGDAIAASQVNQDLVLSTAGEGPQSISRTFQIQPGTKNVKVRYRFITSEVPGGYFGSRYNDYFNVSIRTKNGGGIVSESNSMNGLGLAAFDSGGRTSWSEKSLSVNATGTTAPAWRELSLPVAAEGDTIQIDLKVANVADGLYDSQLVVDFVEEKKLSVTKVALKDIDNTPLKFLSAAPHPYFNGNTRIHGTITVEGAEDDQLSSLVLQVVEGGGVVATANLSEGARNILLNHPFGQAGKLEITTSQLLFELPSSQAGNVNGTTNSSLTLQIKAVSQRGEEATKGAGKAEKLVLYTRTNRYLERNEDEGGDGWVKPSVKPVAEHYSGMLWGDFSNMNGGHIAPHGSHQTGNDVDGYFAGYEARNAATAARIISQLNDATYGSRITTVWVAYTISDTNAFWVAIKDVTLNDGRKARDVIRPEPKHTGHFHWRISD